eukprot:UN08369
MFCRLLFADYYPDLGRADQSGCLSAHYYRTALTYPTLGLHNLAAGPAGHVQILVGFGYRRDHHRPYRPVD